MAATHIDAVDGIEIKNGVVCVSAVSEGDLITWKMPLFVFRRALGLACKRLVEHDASGEVVVFKRHN